jgi:hypothetical protein
MKRSIRPVLLNYRPTLAFKLMTSASQKRAYTALLKFRNHKERNGSRLFYGDPYCELEYAALRQRIAFLEDSVLRIARFSVDHALIESRNA